MKIQEAKIVKKYKEENLNRLWLKFKKFNSVLKQKEWPFDINEIYNSINRETHELVELKFKIYEACLPMKTNLIKISELEKYLKLLKEVPGHDGPYKGLFDRDIFERKAFFGEKNLDEMILNCMKEIEKLKLEVNQFTRSTEINL